MTATITAMATVLTMQLVTFLMTQAANTMTTRAAT